MSAEEEQYEDSAVGGPGAPTPVSALEVNATLRHCHRVTGLTKARVSMA